MQEPFHPPPRPPPGFPFRASLWEARLASKSSYCTSHSSRASVASASLTDETARAPSSLAVRNEGISGRGSREYLRRLAGEDDHRHREAPERNSLTSQSSSNGTGSSDADVDLDLTVSIPAVPPESTWEAPSHGGASSSAYGDTPLSPRSRSPSSRPPTPASPSERPYDADVGPLEEPSLKQARPSTRTPSFAGDGFSRPTLASNTDSSVTLLPPFDRHITLPTLAEQSMLSSASPADSLSAFRISIPTDHNTSPNAGEEGGDSSATFPSSEPSGWLSLGQPRQPDAKGPLRTRRRESLFSSQVDNDELMIFVPPLARSLGASSSAGQASSFASATGSRRSADTLAPPPPSSAFSPSTSTAWSTLSPCSVSTAPTEDLGFPSGHYSGDEQLIPLSAHGPIAPWSTAMHRCSPTSSHSERGRYLSRASTPDPDWHAWSEATDARVTDRNLETLAELSPPQTPGTAGNTSKKRPAAFPDVPALAISTPEDTDALSSPRAASVSPTQPQSFLARLEAARSTEVLLPAHNATRSAALSLSKAAGERSSARPEPYRPTVLPARHERERRPGDETPADALDETAYGWLKWLDRVSPAQAVFMMGFLFGPYCWILGGWGLRSYDGEIRKTVKPPYGRCRGSLDGARWVRANRVAASISALVVIATVAGSCAAVF